MWIYILYLLLVFVTISLAIIEKQRFQTYLSPFIIFSIPYLMIVMYQIIIIRFYNWQNISLIFIITILFYFVSFFLSGHLIVSVLQTFNPPNELWLDPSKEKGEVNITSSKIIESIFLMTAIFLLFKFLTLVNGLQSYGVIVQDGFQKEYSSSGGFFLRLITMIGGTYFWGITNRKNKRAFFYGLLCFSTNFLTFVKGIAYIIILSGIISNIMINGRKVKFRTLIQTGVLGIIMFFSVYIIEIGIWEPYKIMEIETYQFIFAKLNVYLVSGVQSFNINITNNYDYFSGLSNIVYAPLANLFAKVGIVERIDVLNDTITQLGYIHNYGQVNVNTNTYIGTLALYSGIFKGLVLNSFISIFVYYLFYKVIRERSVLNISMYALVSTGLVLSWFEYYYMHTFWFYLIFFFFVLKIIFRIKQNYRKRSIK